jgi:hypothetical protein
MLMVSFSRRTQQVMCSEFEPWECFRHVVLAVRASASNVGLAAPIALRECAGIGSGVNRLYRA